MLNKVKGKHGSTKVLRWEKIGIVVELQHIYTIFFKNITWRVPQVGLVLAECPPN